MTVQLGLYEKAMPAALSWPERLGAAGEAGFDFVEISIDETGARLTRLDWTAAERAELSRAACAGVPVRSMCLSAHRKYPLGSADAAVRARSMEIMRGALRLACDVGIRVVQLAGYDVYYEPSTPDTARRFRDNVAACAEEAAAYGVLLGFETMETPFMDTTAKAMAYVRAVDSPFLGVYPDAGNLTNASLVYGVPVADDLRAGAGRLVALHMKETMPGVYREVPFGAGHVDFDAVARAALSLGVRRFVAELWDDGNPAWRGTIGRAAAFVRGVLSRAAALPDGC